jgi:hypothetical protein
VRYTHGFVSSLILAAVIAAPVAMFAAPGPQSVQVRVYDRDHKDYHNWDDHENHAWGLYLSDNHKKTREYSRSSRKDQSNYWAWRHSHPD